MRFLADLIRGTTTSGSNGTDKSDQTSAAYSPGQPPGQRAGKRISAGRARSSGIGFDLPFGGCLTFRDPDRRTTTLDTQLSDFILAFPVLVFSMVAHEYAHAVAALPSGRRHRLHAGPGHAQPAAAHRSGHEHRCCRRCSGSASSGQFIFGGRQAGAGQPAEVPQLQAGRHHRLRGRGDDQFRLWPSCWRCCSCCSGLRRRRCPSTVTVLETAQRMMMWGVWLNLLLCFFNLIPIPPLDGSHLFYYLLPPACGQLVSGLAAVRLPARCSCMLVAFRGRCWRVPHAGVRDDCNVARQRSIAPFAVGDGLAGSLG